MKFIVGKKLGMTQVFNEKGESLPVTLVECFPGVATQIKSEESDGYDAVQWGFNKLKDSKLKKSQATKPYKYLREQRGKVDITKGDKISVDIFTEGEKVKVCGISKGQGFAGVMKRWNFAGASATHGTKDTGRAPGSVGSMYPQRVMKGKKMAGRMGADKVTVKNLKIVKIDTERGIMAVNGAVPGARGRIILVESN